MTTTLREKSIKSPTPVKAPSRISRLVRGLIRNLVWCFGTFIVSLLVLEVALRACGVGGEEYLKMDPTIGFTHLENKPIVVRSEGWSYDPANSKGIRDYEYSVTAAPGVHRVAFLGDSKTESIQVPLKDNFPKEIERRLNAKSSSGGRETAEGGSNVSNALGGKVECINFGMSGYGTAQEVLQYMRDVRQYKPEVTVLVYHVLDNDENTAPVQPETFTPRPYFSVNDQGVLKPDWLFLDAWFCSERAVYFKACDWLRRNSYVLGVLAQIDKTSKGQKYYDLYQQKVLLPIYESLANLVPAVRYKPDEVAMAQRASLAKEFEKPVSNFGSTSEEQIPDRPPGFLENDYNVLLLNHRLHFRVTAALIRKLNQVCKENGSKLVVATLPAPTSQIFYFKEVNALQQISKEEGFDFVNLHEAFPKSAGGESSPLFVGFHFSRLGHNIVANELTPVIERNLKRN
ncbi:hypothetical protein KF913_16840 [Candidatus Obscuribacterales bacterium]|nr:hypothetical protein [Candidatus Obscuribacterales bacterium]